MNGTYTLRDGIDPDTLMIDHVNGYQASAFNAQQVVDLLQSAQGDIKALKAEVERLKALLIIP